MPDFEFFPVPRAAQQDPVFRTLGSAPYTDFAANSTYTLFVGGLSRRARARSFVVTNTLNEPITSLTFYLFDSSLSTYSNTKSGQSFTDSAGVQSNAYAQYTSEAAPVLAFHGDSVALVLSMGATAPTSGSVTLSVVEVF
jgi:hypothetical protein